MLFNNWNISGCVKFRMLDNKTSSFDVSGDIPEGWSWQLLYSCNGNLNIVEMQHEENILSVIFTKEMLPTDGTYLFQLKATKDDLVKHTNIVKSYVNKSLSGDINWPTIPTEFTQIEQVVKVYAESAKESSIKAENAAVHSPIIGENGNWFIWDFEKSEYVDSGKPASIGGGTDLSLGITGAQVGQIVKITEVDTDGKPTRWKAVDDRLPNTTIHDDGKALIVRQISEFDTAYVLEDTNFISLGIDGASPGQFARIKVVDDVGQPVVWEAVDMAGEEKWEKIADVALTADTSVYELANFGIYRKIKATLSRAAYVSGLKKNVWFRIRTANMGGNQYAGLYMSSEYGYKKWEITGEIGKTFTRIQKKISNNDVSPQSVIETVDILSPANPSECGFYIDFMDTSVIQDGDTVAVYGVRRHGG